MKSSKEKLENLSNTLFAETQYYSYNRDAKEIPQYRKGALTSIKYLQELIKYHLDREKKIQELFVKQIEEQEELVKQLDKSDYTQAILDMMNYAKYEIDNKNPERVSVIQAKKKY